MDNQLLIILLFGSLTSLAVGCQLPFADDTWLSSTRGNWNVTKNGTVVYNFKAALTATLSTASLNCNYKSGANLYVLDTTFELFFGVLIQAFICLDIRKITDYSYVYYIVTDVDSTTGERFTSDNNSVCGSQGYETPINAHVLVRKGYAASAAQTFPNVILGNYSVTYADRDGFKVENSTLDTCNDTTLMNYGNHNTTVKLAFTSGSKLLCLYSLSSGSLVYVHTYNNDSSASVDSKYTFTLACWVLAYTSEGVAATVYPGECVDSQTSTSVRYPGQKFTFIPYITCPIETPTPTTPTPPILKGWEIALVALGIICFIILVIFFILYIRDFLTSRRGKLEDEEGIIKEKLKAQNEYTAKLGQKESRFDDQGKFKRHPREQTFDLLEVNKRKEHALDLVEIKKGEDQQPENRNIKSEPDKRGIPLPTSRPEEDDSTLMRKERERRDREREEKKKRQEILEQKEKKEHKVTDEKLDQIIKHVRSSSSSDEYETDDEEKEERLQKLLQKRKRLENAAYQPPEGVVDVTVVGKKKRRKLREGEDGLEKDGTLLSRDEQEKQDSKRRNRKKALNKIARDKLRTASDSETSSSDHDRKYSRGHRHKKRKGHHDRSAPYIKQYHVKKHIEKELDDINYWADKEKKVDPFLEDLDADDVNGKAKETESVNSAISPEDVSPSRLAAILKEEADGWEALGFPGFKLGPNSELPEGFHFDEEGNVIRDLDGKVIPKDAFKKQLEFRWKYGYVFELPRLKRNTDGRPIGGYKDDPFGPSAEWDYGDFTSGGNEGDEEQKHAESQRPVSGKQVAFSIQDETSVPASPMLETELNQNKGRQLGPEELQLLNARLFEDKQKTTLNQQQSSLPVYFVSKDGGVKPESVYIDNTQIQRQEPPKIETKHRASSDTSNKVVRSDTLDDGRLSKMGRNSRTRSSWTDRKSSMPVVESKQDAERGLQGISKGRRNLGSDDEFILVGGSFKKLNKPPEQPEHSNLCLRYERTNSRPSRSSRTRSELNNMSMRTAMDSARPLSWDKRKVKNLLGEFYKDKKYFDYYLKTEELPTNAAAETRDLASHGIDFLIERANYRQEHLPVSTGPPPSELGLRLSRMRTFVDQVKTPLVPSAASRPMSADNAQGHVRLVKQANDVIDRLAESDVKSELDTNIPERRPPTGRLEPAQKPIEIELIREETVTIDETPRDMKKHDKRKIINKSPKTKKSKLDQNDKNLPGAVITISEC